MGAFEYQALDDRGHTVKGVLEGDAERQIRALLRDRGLTPLKVDAITEQTLPSVRHGGSRAGLSTNELAMITRQFSTLVQAGLTIDEALNALIEQTESARTRSILAGVRAKVLEGQSLAQALGAFPGAFPVLYRNMVDAGEQSGQLDGVMERLADYTENRQALQQKVLLAFIYPALVVLVALLSITGLMIYVVPQVTRVFINTGQTLPWLTSALINASEFLKTSGVFVVAGIVASVIGFRLLLRQEAIRFRWHRFLLTLPVVGRMIRGIDAARVTSTLGILTNSGIPLLSALESSIDIVSSLPMRAAMEATYKTVREGGSLSKSLAKSKLFPPMIIHLIASGEATGRLDAMLIRAAETQSRELENRVRALTAVLEPVLLLITGGLILMIVLAILLPIFEMNQLVL
ncbi:MAG: type II secretion system inner membrane protein GspF [Acidiferrobacterales bacterium]